MALARLAPGAAMVEELRDAPLALCREKFAGWLRAVSQDTTLRYLLSDLCHLSGFLRENELPFGDCPCPVVQERFSAALPKRRR